MASEAVAFLNPVLGSYKRGVVDVESYKRLNKFVDDGFKRFGIPKSYGVNNRYIPGKKSMGYYTPRRRLTQLRSGTVLASPRPVKRSRRTPIRASRSRTSAPTSGQGAKVGHPVGYGTAKRAITDAQWASGTVKNAPYLYTYLINDIAQIDDNTGVEINRRERAMINLLGFDIRYYAENKFAASSLKLNMAVISPKQRTDVTNADFFRGYATSRGTNFDIITQGAATLNFNPINRDLYNVLWQDSCILGSDSDVNGSANYNRTVSNFKTKKEWIPVNRQIRYDGNADVNVSDPIYFVYWACPVGFIENSGIQNDHFSFRHQVVTYFKEPGA